MSEPEGQRIRFEVRAARTGEVDLHCAGWSAFRLERLRPSLRCDDTELCPTLSSLHQAGPSSPLSIQYLFGDLARLTLEFTLWSASEIRISSSLCNTSHKDIVLQDVALLGARSEAGGICFGAAAGEVTILEQGNYWGRVRQLTQIKFNAAEVSAGEPNTALKPADSTSQAVSVVYDRVARMALLAGFMTSERWLGEIRLAIQSHGMISDWRMGFDGGDLCIKPRQEVDLEKLVFAAGDDPWALLERYADAVAEPHKPQFPASSPVSWCSWYPYRLSVTEERVLQNARIAADRLQPLGMKVIEVDLGWERRNLPSAFDENERFGHGLKWLAEELRKLGFCLGAWKAPFTISEFDPVSKEHPEWLIGDHDRKPLAYWEWYWEPHGKVFILDLTHPGARAWLQEKIATLYQRGVRYLKADFIGCVSDSRAKLRHDPTIVAGGGCEAARMAAQLIREALPDALLLNCGGPEMPGTGQWPLLYSCNDTGNTGFISHAFQQTNYQTVACHLFKNRRWGILQPSCLCVGPPGTLEDARIRATVAFLTGGQIDISDDLTSLPEDRWSVLTATLPPLGCAAKPVDLFEPLSRDGSYDYSTVTSGRPQGAPPRDEHPPGSVWHVRVAADWDEWDLVAVFSFAEGSAAKAPAISRFSIPYRLLGIPDEEVRWGYEFWSGQFLGIVTSGRDNPGQYAHPGDFQDLKVGGAPGVLQLGFFGPSVKLLCLRRPRPHPWVAGASFHQSCGLELKDVMWNPAAAILSGLVCRPRGASGFLVIAPGGMFPARAEVDGRPRPTRPGARGSIILPLTLTQSPVSWSLRFEKQENE